LYFVFKYFLKSYTALYSIQHGAGLTIFPVIFQTITAEQMSSNTAVREEISPRSLVTLMWFTLVSA